MEFDLYRIKKLEKEYNLPLYIFDEKGFCENYRNLEAEMQSLYPEYRVSYSYKTNYTPYVCNTVKKLGGYAEVVSGMEYYIARKIGYESSQIIFNGPDKGQDGIEAFLLGTIVNADSIDELQQYINIAKEYSERQFKIGLRVNLNLGQNFVSRFGMDEIDIEKAMDLIHFSSNVKLAGLHCHISRCRSKDAWQKRTEIMLGLADQYFDEVPEYIDLGSGMFGSMEPEFAAQFSNVPTYQEYALVTAGVFAEHYKGKCKRPILFTEPGTTLVNRFFSLIAKVNTIKTIREKTFAVLNCSEHNLGETCTLKQLPMKIVVGGLEQHKYASVDFTGYTCLEQDVMYKNFEGKLADEDYVVFGNVGGYSNVYKPPFIRPNCAIVAEKVNGDIAIIKSKETYEDLLHTYVF